MFIHIEYTKIWGVICRAEEAWYKGDLDANKRRDWAIAEINSLIDVSFLPEVAEAILIGVLIDAMIFVANKVIGHDWFSKKSMEN